jgi:ABC-2 type transport system permease protein
VPWFKLLTLANPLTYASEGLRSAIVPEVPHMPTAVAAGMLAVATVVFALTGVRGFMRRAID